LLNSHACLVKLRHLIGNYVNGKLTGRGLMLSSKETCFDGEFADDFIFAGKGTLKLSSGDTVEGLITGDWNDKGGIKVRSHIYNHMQPG
jgi:hypothetical protein